MPDRRKKAPPRELMPVPEFVRNPRKLRQLAFRMDLEPATLLATVEQDYAQWQPLAHPAIYEARGPEKGGLLVVLLQQCKLLADEVEQVRGEGVLSRTLQHAQAQLTVLLADYEDLLGH